jgi:hypothetical protein
VTNCIKESISGIDLEKVGKIEMIFESYERQ